MEKPVLISIAGTQRFAGDEPDTIELVTHGTYRYEPGCITLSYVETEMRRSAARGRSTPPWSSCSADATIRSMTQASAR